MTKQEHYEKYIKPLFDELALFVTVDISELETESQYCHPKLIVGNFEFRGQCDLENKYVYAWQLFLNDDFLINIKKFELNSIVKFVFAKPDLAAQILHLQKSFNDEVAELQNVFLQIIEDITKEESVEITKMNLNSKINALFNMIKVAKNIKYSKEDKSE